MAKIRHLHNDKMCMKLACKRRGLFGCPPTPGLVYLIGCREEDSPYWEKQTIILKHDRCCAAAQPKGADGYDPKLMLCDFTGDRQDNIYLSTASGGSGGYEFFYVYGYHPSKCKLDLLLDHEGFNAISQYIAYFVDGFKLAVIQRDGDKSWMVDLSCRGNTYLEQIYYPDGSLKQATTAMVSDANYSEPVFNKQTGHFDLLVYQRITGLYNADLIGHVITSLAYHNNQFMINGVTVSSNVVCQS